MPRARAIAFHLPRLLLDPLRMPISRKRFFRLPVPAATTIYVRSSYNRVLAEEFEALKLKRVGLVADKVEAHSQGDLRENFGFKAAKDAIRAVDRKMTALDRFVARNTFIEVDPATWLTKPTSSLQLGRFVARNTFIEVDPATWLTKPTSSLQLGHVVGLEKQDEGV